jgi:hypothetical protein
MFEWQPDLGLIHTFNDMSTTAFSKSHDFSALQFLKKFLETEIKRSEQDDMSFLFGVHELSRGGGRWWWCSIFSLFLSTSCKEGKDYGGCPASHANDDSI